MRALTEALVRYCAEEVERQRTHPTAVWWMVQAWLQAMDDYAVARGTMGGPRVILPDTIAGWGKLVEPELNPKGFRWCGVYVGGRRCPEWPEVPRLIANLCEAVSQGRLNPAEAYLEFQLIHPFADGNGRTGKILFNYVGHTLHDPQMPPNFFGCANP